MAYWLVVGPPLWKISTSLGMIIPNIWENKKWQPNHPPDINGIVLPLQMRYFPYDSQKMPKILPSGIVPSNDAANRRILRAKSWACWVARLDIYRYEPSFGHTWIKFMPIFCFPFFEIMYIYIYAHVVSSLSLSFYLSLFLSQGDQKSIWRMLKAK